MKISIAHKVVGVLLLLTLLPVATRAASLSEVQAKIVALMEQIKTLQAQLQTIQPTTTSSSNSGVASRCQMVNVNLTLGNSGTETTNLQQALIDSGYLQLPTGTSPGYFGMVTRTAVIKWQSANGITPTGYFGPVSRTKLNSGVTPTCSNASQPTSSQTTSTGPLPTSGTVGSSASQTQAAPKGEFYISPGALSLGVASQVLVEALYSAPAQPDCQGCGVAGAPTPHKVKATWSSSNSAVATVKEVQIQCFRAPCEAVVVVEGKSAGATSISASYVSETGAIYTSTAQVTVSQ